MNRAELFEQIKAKKSYLCVGLDTDINKIPEHLKSEDDPIFAFNKAIIDATKHVAVAYKPNLAFYESLGPAGWESLKKTIDYIPEDIFTIADAKRGDIGNTSEMYAKTFFDYLDFDSVTVAPYMGEDSVTPFLRFEDKWVIVLALTSNPGSNDFQHLESDGEPIFGHVVRKTQEWTTPDNLMFVVGATRGEGIGEVRKRAPEHFFLVPGVGKQGGSLDDVAKYGMNDTCGLLVNSSRGIIYASQDVDFADAAKQEAEKLQVQMAQTLLDKGLI